MIEYRTESDDWNLQQLFNEGWELMTVYYVDGVQHESVNEPIQTFHVSTGIGTGQPGYGAGGGYGYQQPQQQYASKSVPIVVRKPRFILKRTAAAKIL